jgi:hypothetical protein
MAVGQEYTDHSIGVHQQISEHLHVSMLNISEGASGLSSRAIPSINPHSPPTTTQFPS